MLKNTFLINVFYFLVLKRKKHAKLENKLTSVFIVNNGSTADLQTPVQRGHQAERSCEPCGLLEVWQRPSSQRQAQQCPYHVHRPVPPHYITANSNDGSSRIMVVKLTDAG